MAGPREEDEVESGFWGDGIFSAEADGFSGEADRLGWEVLGEISWRGPDVGSNVCGDSSSKMTSAVKVPSLVVSVSGGRFSSMPDGRVAVVDHGSGSTT